MISTKMGDNNAEVISPWHYQAMRSAAYEQASFRIRFCGPSHNIIELIIKIMRIKLARVVIDTPTISGADF